MSRYTNKMNGVRRAGAAGLAAVVAASLAACGGGGDGSSSSGTAAADGGTFTILQYEDPTTPQGEGWKVALDLFKEKHPDVTVDFQATSFDGFRKNAKLTLGGNKVPDVIEFNKGNADGGQLAAQGLLDPLTEAVEKFGWDEKVTGSMLSFAKYDANGNAGDGDWYGIPNVGEYATFFYNKDMFAEAGITEVPDSIEGFEAAMDKLLAKGITPIASSAATNQGFNQLWLWYGLVSAYADRQDIDDFMFVRDPVDFEADPWKKGTEKFQEWIDKGYVGTDLAGLTFEQATVNFLSGKAAMVLWNQSIYNRVHDEAPFEWGSFTFPGANLGLGSSGHLWGVPAKSANKDLAYDWIDITLSPEVQNAIGERGGLPIVVDLDVIDDPATKLYTEGYVEMIDKDAFSFYPDYPVPGFLDFQQTHMAAMSNKNETAAEFLPQLQTFYDDGTADAR